MRIHIGTDHAGFELKNAIVKHLGERGLEVIDHGAVVYDSTDDYPAPCIACAEATVLDPGSLGIVIGGSGNGEQMAANKVTGARAALIWNEATAFLSRQHNDANLASLGARQHSVEEALHLVDVFVDTPFSQEERHQRRIEQLAEYEARRG